jgi:RND family efflux transporter MFP subunit
MRATFHFCGVFIGAAALTGLAGWTLPVFGQFGPAPVAVAPVVQREVAAGKTFVGTVRPLRSSSVGSPVDGRVDEFLVNEGDRVKKGQPIARLRTKTLELELAANRAELDYRKQELAELESGYRAEEIEQAKAYEQMAEARMEYAKARAQRTQNLFQQGRATNQEEVQEALSNAKQAEQAHRQAKAMVAMALEGHRKERIAQGRARVQVQEEQIRLLEDALDKHTIVAPFDGYITAEHTEVGHWLMRSSPVVDVIELDQVDVEVHVLEDDVVQVPLGATVRVEIGALVKEVFTGRVAVIVPQANLKARSFPVKVRLENRFEGTNALLKAGMFARVTLPVGKKEPALLVSKDALVLGGPTPMVYVVDADAKNPKQGKVRPVPVELGIADGNLAQVKGGLQVGQQVVVQGNERLFPGQDVVVTQVLEPTVVPGKSSSRAGND